MDTVFLTPVNARQHRVAREIAIFVLSEQADVKPVDGDIDSLGLCDTKLCRKGRQYFMAYPERGVGATELQ
ncbi:MAG: hypothetical protein ACYDEV_08510 [Acidiferrobacter sp.]